MGRYLNNIMVELWRFYVTWIIYIISLLFIGKYSIEYLHKGFTLQKRVFEIMFNENLALSGGSK